MKEESPILFMILFACVVCFLCLFALVFTIKKETDSRIDQIQERKNEEQKKQETMIVVIVPISDLLGTNQ